MNVGGPAVQVSGLMRGLSATDFDQRLYGGSCGKDEAITLKNKHLIFKLFNSLA
jgi:hypothetical protein